MRELLGIIFLLGGVSGLLYQWILVQREKQKRMEAFTIFLRKSIFMIEKEKIKLIDYFQRGCTDTVLQSILCEIARRLSENRYPDALEVWEAVFRENKERTAFDEETFHIILESGRGLFGCSRTENICFLKKSLSEMEEQQRKIREKDAQARKVWVPVGMLGAVLLVILLI